MKRRLLAATMLCGLLAGCGRGGGPEEADANVAAANTSTTATTGSPSSIGAYGPAEIATPVFVEKAAISDMYEIGASRLALKRAHVPEIKAFAQEMVTAHEGTSTKLKGIVAQGGTGATIPAALDPAHARLLEELDKAPADKFDARYLDQQTQAHREALGLMNSYATHGQDAALKRFADETRPAIQAHLEAASKLDHSGIDDKAKAAAKSGG